MKDRFTNEYLAFTAGGILIVSGILALIFEDPKPYLLGWIFGGLIAMAMFKSMFFTLTRAMEKSEEKASSYVRLHYFFRFVLYAIVLIIAAKADYLNLVATFFGLLSVKYVILIRNMVDYLRSKKGGGF